MFCILINIFAIAQQNYQDVVYLKNGSIIRGIIIEQVPNKSIKIETADRSVFVYQMGEIEKITKELVYENTKSYYGDSFLKSGFQGIVELGYAFGVGDYGMDLIKLNIINGYRFNHLFTLGFGTGIRYYFDLKTVLLPIFAYFRVSFATKNISPYLSFGLGYSFDLTNGFERFGFLLNPSAG